MSGLSIRGLTVRRGEAVVLEDVSFSAAAGAVTAVLGPAGAGKTSLFAALAGLMPVTRGAVFCDGVDVTRVRGRRRGVAFLPPGTGLSESRMVEAALRQVAGRSSGDDVGGVIAALGLSAVLARKISALGHGEAFLAMAGARLLAGAGVLLVDEACVGLDRAAQAGFWAWVRRRAGAGDAVLLGTRAAEMGLAADQLVLLDGGQVVQASTPATVYAEPRDIRAARMVGAANLLEGTLRELRPGGFIWSNGGRFRQELDTEAMRPALGSSVRLCLRPELISLLGEGDAADNVLEGRVIAVRSAGAMLHAGVDTAWGVLDVAVPSGRPRVYPQAGQAVRLGWDAGASVLLAGEN